MPELTQQKAVTVSARARAAERASAPGAHAARIAYRELQR